MNLNKLMGSKRKVKDSTETIKFHEMTDKVFADCTPNVYIKSVDGVGKSFLNKGEQMAFYEFMDSLCAIEQQSNTYAGQSESGENFIKYDFVTKEEGWYDKWNVQGSVTFFFIIGNQINADALEDCVILFRKALPHFSTWEGQKPFKTKFEKVAETEV